MNLLVLGLDDDEKDPGYFPSTDDDGDEDGGYGGEDNRGRDFEYDFLSERTLSKYHPSTHYFSGNDSFG